MRLQDPRERDLGQRCNSENYRVYMPGALWTRVRSAREREAVEPRVEM